MAIKAYFTAAEAAEYAGVSQSTLSKLRQRGTGCPYVRIGASKTKAVVRYKKSDLDRWMEQHKIKTFGGA